MHTYLFFDLAFCQNCLKNIPCQVFIGLCLLGNIIFDHVGALRFILSSNIAQKLEVSCLFKSGLSICTQSYVILLGNTTGNGSLLKFTYFCLT